MMLMGTCWELTQRWYEGRLEKNWRRPGPKETQALFEELGLVGEFWRVT
jgi:hypothetical protein